MLFILCYAPAFDKTTDTLYFHTKSIRSSYHVIIYSMLNSDMSQVAANPASLRIPDIQNCLYWNPTLKLKGAEPVRVSFNAGNCAGNYLIVVRGVDKNTNIKVSTSEIRVY